MSAWKLQDSKDEHGRYILQQSERTKEEVEKDAQENKQALIEVHSSALNHRDNWITRGLYPGLTFGTVLGSDCVGSLLACFDEGSESKSLLQDRGIKSGDEVIVDPSVNWPRHHPRGPVGTLSILGMPYHGSFANYLSVPTKCIYKKPDFLSQEEAAALPLAGVTAYRALVTKGGVIAGSSSANGTSLSKEEVLRMNKGTDVLVLGIGGGVALFALQFAVALGCNVYVTSSDDGKIERAVKEFGAKGGANYAKDADWAKKQFANASPKIAFDVVIDGAGGDGLSNVIGRLLKSGGRVVCYGATAGPSTSLVLPKLFLNNAELLGTAMGSPEDFEGMVKLVQDFKIKPIVDSTYPLHELPKALDKMRNGKQFGKLVLRHRL